MEFSLSQLIDQHRENLREIDVQFARFCYQLCKHDALATLALLVSDQLGRGNVCLDTRLENPMLSNTDLKRLVQQSKVALEQYSGFPLVIDEGRVYMQRYYEYERFVADRIQRRCHVDMEASISNQSNEVKTLPSALEALFPQQNDPDDIDWQKVAVSIAAQSALTVITGGPGTGKTTTVIKLLALLSHQHNVKNRQPIVKLAAPTGKAAMRLTESIGQAKNRLQIAQDTKNSIPEEAFTLHRLLKRNRLGDFHHNEMNPLHLDILVVDEASMIDLPMMAKLLAALPEHCRLVLLGDKDQLSSVEAGSVLADICDSGQSHGYDDTVIASISQLTGIPTASLSEHVSESKGAPIRNHICHLRKSHRFSEDSGIAALAKAANQGDYELWQRTIAKNYDDLELLGFTDASVQKLITDSAKQFARVQSAISSSHNTDDVARQVHESFNQYRILCAVKEGDLGVTGINDAIERVLGYSDDTWYPGRPIMIQQNDYGLNLYNGDVGIVLPCKIDGETQLRVSFLTAENDVRWLQPARLPQHETVYAMTVHKSQGSEFEHCTLILPDYQVPVLTKELLYTGITRAKARLTLLARDKLVAYTLRNQVQRASGLRDRLWRLDETVISPETEQFSLF